LALCLCWGVETGAETGTIERSENKLREVTKNKDKDKDKNMINNTIIYMPCLPSDLRAKPECSLVEQWGISLAMVAVA